ncbi:hypothetical protein LEP1GSC101_1152 [Leptospira borgpetersenii str. UI 09149]|uniref:Uncharacterized protein n=1 Tax=Leptospira borgpetersenii str. 200701203 TaxID=1193007 RepID=M3GSF8_LEPBO|nr:hypothetical protein LEP1GSC101_1152 [Leptospira borgpetersenii str. UI 09149]EMF97768.1 hypothetical protein LEP1GSC123_0938 [Leptospira borgpetersenii str. 200701203]
MENRYRSELHPVPYSVNSFVKTVITLSVFALETIRNLKEIDCMHL